MKVEVDVKLLNRAYRAVKRLDDSVPEVAALRKDLVAEINEAHRRRIANSDIAPGSEDGAGI